jgi:CSLREA domain-containing protein
MLRCLRLRHSPLALAALLLGLAAAPPLQATLFVPSKTADSFDGACDSDCSLREAIAAANDHVGPDVVVLGGGVYVLTLPGAGEDLGASGDLDVRDDLDLVGSDPALTVLDGGGLDRVLDLFGARLDVQGVTLRNGRVEGDGGGVRNRFGQLTLGDTAVSGNTAVGGAGGGVWSYGELTLVRTTLAGNTADGNGGGLNVRQKLVLGNVTVSGNHAAQGGGLYFVMPVAGQVVNATIADNTAGGRGGGVLSEVPSSVGSGVAFGSSILAGNSAAADRDCGGPALSAGFNLVGIGGGCGAFAAAKGDQVGTAQAPLDARLAPLADAGGPTPTHPLRADSPAVDAGQPPPVEGEAVAGLGCEAVDQRGAQRPGWGSARCDAGAFELTGACVAAADTLCLGGGRFRVQAASKLPQQAARAGGAVGLTGDSGAFWFFAPSNVELTVKVLDACALSGRSWVFLSGLTDVEVEVTVEDTATGLTRSYRHARGKPFAPILDTDAFATCGVVFGGRS